LPGHGDCQEAEVVNIGDFEVYLMLGVVFEQLGAVYVEKEWGQW
jgi:hypothetical protein